MHQPLTRAQFVLAALAVLGACLLFPLTATSAWADTYASLGDSYSSGEGAGSYDSATDGNHGCHRSYLAWPRLLGVPIEGHFACSGAVFANLHPGHKANHPDDKVGQIDELASYVQRRPVDRVVMTMGGNDIGFSHIIKACFAFGDVGCLNNLGDIKRHLERLRATWAQSYRDIVQAAGAPLLVVGYPDILPGANARSYCHGWAGKSSRRRAGELVSMLDGAFRAAVSDANQGAAHEIDFLPVDSALKRHEECSKDPWMYPIHVVGGGQQRGHPNKAGQWAIARVVRRWLDSHQAGVTSGPCAPASSVAAIIDDSGSMAENDPDGIRGRAMELLLAKPNEQGRTIGAIEFGDYAGPLFAPAVVSSARAQMIASLAALQNDGAGNGDPANTDYNAAFDETKAEQPNAAARIFLTDGAHNEGPYLNGHSPGPPTYVIGLNIGPAGEGSDDADRLGQIAADTGGIYYPLLQNDSDTPEVQVGRLQGVINDIDARLSCQTAQTTTPVSLQAQGKPSPVVSNLVGKGQRGAQITLTWANPQGTSVGLSAAAVRNTRGQVIADLQGKRRLSRHSHHRGKKLAFNIVQASTFQVLSFKLPKGARTLAFRVAGSQLQGPTDVTVQVRPISAVPPPGFTRLADPAFGASGTTTTSTATSPPPAPPAPPHPVDAYSNYGSATAGHAMCRGNPGNSASLPGGIAAETFTVPDGVASINTALVQIDPDSTVTAHATLAVNGTGMASDNAAAAGDTRFNFSPVPVSPGDQVTLRISFTASSGKIITVYSGGQDGTLQITNSCPAGAASLTTSAGLRAVISGESP